MLVLYGIKKGGFHAGEKTNIERTSWLYPPLSLLQLDVHEPGHRQESHQPAASVHGNRVQGVVQSEPQHEVVDTQVETSCVTEIITMTSGVWSEV